MPDTKTKHRYIAYFGYGSLVNRATHQTDIADFSKVRLKGWRRQWLSRLRADIGPVAMLSVVPDMQCEIEGLVVTDHAHNLPAVDAREIRYNRQVLQADDLKYINGGNGNNIPVNIYVAKPVETVGTQIKGRILRSYLDAVMQGYHNKFGRDGLHRFVQTTSNFDVGVREDRANPFYPRPVTTTAKERALFDTLVPGGK